MDYSIVASILAITYGLVEVIKWLLKSSLKKTEKQENVEQTVLMLEKLRQIEALITAQNVQMNEIVRILDRVTMTEAALAEIAKETNKMVAKSLKRSKK